MEGIIINNCGRLNYGKARIKLSSFKNEWNQTYSFSCTAKDDDNLRRLSDCSSAGDCTFIVSGTVERRYPRYPRKMKKALKKLAKGGCRKTRLMNKLAMCGHVF